jgi:hypothetical protein
VWFGRLNSL